MPSKLTKDLKKIVEWFFPEVINASSYFFSVVWLAIYALSLTVFARQFRPLMEKYYQSDVLVSVAVDDVMHLNLPQITICPGRLFAKSNVKAVMPQYLYELPMIDLNQEEYVKKILSGKSNITFNGNSNCPEHFFRCRNSKQCIPDIWFCDREVDCNDSSDENLNCKYKYKKNKYCMTTWKYKQCSPYSLKCGKFCDNDIECTYSEDEKSCEMIFLERRYHATNKSQDIELIEDSFPGFHNRSFQVSHIISEMNADYKNIEIQFKKFELHSKDRYHGCVHDYITITYDTNSSKFDGEKYCGLNPPQTKVIPGPVNFTFHSDYTNRVSEFRISFRAIITKSKRVRRVFWHMYSSEYHPPIKLKPLTFQWKEIYKSLADESQIDFTKIHKYLLFDPKVPHNFGTIQSNFIIKANIPRLEETISSYKEFLNAKTGKCFILQANSRQKNNFIAADSGIDSGINLVLFVNEYEDIGFYDRVGGSSISINVEGTYPLPHRNGILLKTGMTTRISLKKQTIQRENGTIKCTKVKPNWEPLGELKMAVKLGYKNESHYKYLLRVPDSHEDPFTDWPTYNQDVCWEYCLHELIRNTCNCVNSYFNLYYDGENHNPETPFPMCNPGNASQIQCMGNVTKSFYFSERTFCDCPRACNDVNYIVKMAYGDFLSKQSMYYFINEVVDGANEEPKKLMTRLLSEFLNNTITEEELLTKIRNNFAKVEIYFEDLKHEVFQERLAYSSQQLMSAFAGNIGMFVGWSVLTFSQVIMVFFHLAYHLVRKVWEKLNQVHH